MCKDTPKCPPSFSSRFPGASGSASIASVPKMWSLQRTLLFLSCFALARVLTCLPFPPAVGPSLGSSLLSPSSSCRSLSHSGNRVTGSSGLFGGYSRQVGAESSEGPRPYLAASLNSHIHLSPGSQPSFSRTSSILSSIRFRPSGDSASYIVVHLPRLTPLWFILEVSRVRTECPLGR